MEVAPLGPETAEVVPGTLIPRPRILATGTHLASLDGVRLAGDIDVLVPDFIPSGLLLQAIMVQPAGLDTVNEVRMYFAPFPVDDQTTLFHVIADGGMLLLERTTRGVDAQVVKQEVRRAVIVEVGAHDAALIWADPMAKGVRSYNLYWSDGERDWTLIAGLTTPESVVSVARSIYCG